MLLVRGTEILSLVCTGALMGFFESGSESDSEESDSEESHSTLGFLSVLSLTSLSTFSICSGDSGSLDTSSENPLE